MFSAVAPGNATDYSTIKLNSQTYTFALTSTGQLEESTGGSWSVLDTNVTNYVCCNLNGLNQLFDLHSNGVLKNTTNGTTLVLQGSGYSEIGTGTLTGTNYLFGLQSTSSLNISHGTGWSKLDNNVTNFVFSNLHGLNQLFDLHADGSVENTINGRQMVSQGSGFGDIGVGTLSGTNYLFGLQTNGNLLISHGTGWSTLDTGVTSFVFSSLNGLNQLFDVHYSGDVDNTIDGRTLSFQGSDFSEIGVGTLAGTNYLFGLQTSGDLLISHGTGWHTLDSGVTNFVYSDLNGLTQLFDLHASGVVDNTTDGQNLSFQGSGFSEIGVSTLAGTNYLLGLQSDGDLLISHGTGWRTLNSNVEVFYVTNNFSSMVTGQYLNGSDFSTYDGINLQASGSVSVSTRYGDELVITADGARDVVVVDQSGTTLRVVADGQTWTESIPAGGVFVYTRGGSDNVTVNSDVTVQTTVASIDNAPTTVWCGNSDSIVWADSTDTVFNASGQTHLVGSYDCGVSKAVGASEANPAGLGTTFTAYGSLFGTGPTINDANQGREGDCWFIAGLAAVANQNPEVIRNAAVDLGDGTYAVQLTRDGVTNYVRVSNEFSTNTVWNFAGWSYANPGPNGGSLWAAVLEKAYAQVRTGANTYDSLYGGYVSETFTALGLKAHDIAPTSMTDAQLASRLSSDLANHVAVAVDTPKGDKLLESPHAYSVIGVHQVNGVNEYELRNAHGLWDVDPGENSNGTITVTYNQLLANVSWITEGTAVS